MSLHADTDGPFKLRHLGVADAASYRELRLEGLKSNPEAFGGSFDENASKTLEWFEDQLKNNMVFGGYTKGGALVGVAGFAVRTAANLRHKGILWGMFVTPRTRGTGLAKLLTERVIEHAQSVVEELILTVVASNIPAVKLYKGLGFEEYGVEPRALKIGSRYHDELLMAFRLRKS